LAEAMRSEVLDLLSKLVSYPSVNDPVKGLKPSRDIVDFIVDWLAKHGVDAEVVESNGFYSVFGVLGREPCVMLMAHFDVVPVSPERWSFDPFRLTIVDGRAYGRGALDDKSNVAAVMIAVKELSRENLGCGVVYALTGDEEIGGANGAGAIAKRLQSEGLTPRFLINADGAGMSVITRRRKAFNVVVEVPAKRVRVRGFVRKAKFSVYYPVSQHAHAAYFIPGADSHPLVAASVFVREGGYPVIQLRGSFLKSNVVPAEVEVEYVEENSGGEEVEVDFGLTELLRSVMTLTRTPIAVRGFSEYGVSATPNVYTFTGEKHRLVLNVRAMAFKEDVEKAFREVVSAVLTGAEIRVETDPGSFMNTPPDSRLVRAFLEVVRSMGFEARIAEGAGASDSRYFTPLGVEAVDFGPRGGGMHGDNEYVEIESLEALPKIYVNVVKKLASQ